MSDIIYHKAGLFGPKLELHIAPEGLALVGRAGRESAAFVPMGDVSEAVVSRKGRKANLTISFGGARPAWTLQRMPAPAAEFAGALITEEKAALDKRGNPAFTQKTPLTAFDSACAKVVSTGDGHAAVDLVDFVLVQAVLHEASDVHFDPYSDAVVVRFRLNGVLRDVARIDPHIRSSLTSRLKIVSRLTTFKKAVAQEGRAALRVGDRTVDFRFSCIPTIHGEKVAARVFDPAKSIFDIESLGMNSTMLASIEGMLLQPQGTILLTGPAGSGKTTTMYAALNYLRRNKKNLSSIATVEDPVEYDLEVVNQTQVNNTSGLTFANALRTVLRQDPEVIMIGEIRDRETAETAIQAGLTGHMILSTVHARSAAGVLLRLIDLGVEPFLLTSSVTAVLSQRLVRTPCKSCAKPYNPTEEEKSNFSLTGGEGFVFGEGCENCAGTGYSGRTGIFQLLPVSNDLREMVLRRCPLSELEAQVERDGAISLLADGLQKAAAGLTTLEELTRVLG